MTPDTDIAPLAASRANIDGLAALLIEAVAASASVTFMHPLSAERARGFWQASLTAADRGERVVLGARSDGRLVGTVTLSLDTPDNQQHRGEISKLITALAHRRCGVARALMREAERIAAERGRILPTLDTAAEDGAAGFYERIGYCRAGMIPDYASKPGRARGDDSLLQASQRRASVERFSNRLRRPRNEVKQSVDRGPLQRYRRSDGQD